MGSMMKELLLIFSLVMVCGGVYIVDPRNLNSGSDTPLEECYVLRGNVKRPSVNPKKCPNQYADIPCGYLYPVHDPSSHDDPDVDYLVSDRCYFGELRDYAEFCASQCALCCETPEFNCSNRLPPDQCDVIERHQLCEEPGMFDFVHFFCRSTCGLCLLPEFNKTLCLDKAPFCGELFGLVPCTVPYMMDYCAGTCFLTGEQCEFPFRPVRPGGGGLGPFGPGFEPGDASRRPGPGGDGSLFIGPGPGPDGGESLFIAPTIGPESLLE